MFPSDSPAQGSGQQYSFNISNVYYMNLPKRSCLPNYPGQQHYPFCPMTSQTYAAPFYPHNYGYPVETTMVPVDQMEDRRRKTVQVLSDDYERPIWTFTGLSLLSLLNSPDNTATTDEIYTFVLCHFPFYIDQNHASWTGAIRHNLTKKKTLFQRNSESKRNGKWSLISVEDAKKVIVREIGKSKKNPRCGMDNTDLFDSLIGCFLPMQTAPTKPSTSPVLSALLSSPPIYYEESPVIQTDQMSIIGTSFQSTPVSYSEYSSPISSDYVFNAPFNSEDFTITQFDQSAPTITLNNFESVPVSSVEDSPTVSVEHLEFDIIEDDF